MALGRRAHQQHLLQAAADRTHAPSQRAGDRDQRHSLRSRATARTSKPSPRASIPPSIRSPRAPAPPSPSKQTSPPLSTPFAPSRSAPARISPPSPAIITPPCGPPSAPAGVRRYTIAPGLFRRLRLPGRLQPLYHRPHARSRAGSSRPPKQTYGQIRQARAAARITRAFDLELVARYPDDRRSLCAPLWNS